jgi:ATP phosphoribosyltransferase regulatory subunit
MVDTVSLRLPAGMRDFAPRAAASRRRIAETLLGVFESWGFARVITPAFEYEEVLGLGLGAAGRAAALKFVEPSSGRVVALRPDITPQIARLIATRFRDEVGPVRLCYEGTVLRLDRGARSQRELIQAGVELAGVIAPHGDAEVIALGAEALAAAGLDMRKFDLTIDLGHLGLMREVLAALALSDAASVALRAAIGKRDPGAMDDVLRSSRTAATNGTYEKLARFVRALPELSGDPGVLEVAIRQAPTPKIRQVISELREIVGVVEERRVPARLHVDLAEVRGFDYYTGVRFQAFVSGAAEPVLQGGRYDDLLGRYGRASAAVGFAIDVEAAAGALEVARGEGPDGDARNEAGRDGSVLVVGETAAAVSTAQTLRASGRRAAPLLAPMPEREIAAYAARWGYGEIVRAGEAKSATRPRARKKEPRAT